MTTNILPAVCPECCIRLIEMCLAVRGNICSACQMNSDLQLAELQRRELQKEKASA